MDATAQVLREALGIERQESAIRSLRQEVADLKATIESLGSAKPQKAMLKWREAAEELGVSVSTLRRRVKDGSIEAPVKVVGLPRFPAEAIRRFKEGQR